MFFDRLSLNSTTSEPDWKTRETLVRLVRKRRHCRGRGACDAIFFPAVPRIVERIPVRVYVRLREEYATHVL